MSLFIGFLCTILLSKSSQAASVSDLNPKTDCKALLAQKTEERVKNPTLVRISFKTQMKMTFFISFVLIFTCNF